MADRAPEQFSPTSYDPLTSAQGEPLPFGAAAGTVLTGAMWIDFHRDGSFDEGLLFPESIDLAPQLVRLLAIEPPGLACSPCLDLAQPFKEQHAAWVLRADAGNGMRGL